MFGLVDQLRAKSLQDATERPVAALGTFGGAYGIGAQYETATRYRSHPDRVRAMRAALVCPPVYVALGMWRDLMRVPTVRCEPAGGEDATPQAKAYADHIKACLGLGVVSPIGTRWSALWDELLGAVEYGFGLWEMVPREVGGVWYTPLAYRDPASVSHWLADANGDLAAAVQQPLTMGSMVAIPASQLLRLTWRPVSRNDFTGTGILRPAATLADDHRVMSQLRLVGVQRFAVGTPFASIDREAAEALGPKAKEDADALEAMLQDYTASERAGGVLPPGWDVKMFGGDFDVSRLNAVISDVARSIYELVMMQWVMLGSGDGGGSYSLGETQLEASRQSAQSVCDWLGGELSASYVPRALRWQFGDVAEADMPRIVFDGLASEAFVRHLDKLAALHQSGLLSIGPESRAKIHGALELAPPEASRPVGSLGLRPQMPEVP